MAAVSGPASPSADAAPDAGASEEGGTPEGAAEDSISISMPAPDSCTRDPSVACSANTVGFLCAGSDRLGSDVIKCSSGVAEDNGIGFCCTLAAGSCKMDSAVECTNGANGYSCTGSDTPAQDGESVLCVSASSQGTANGYCCVAYSSPVCALTPNVTGCPAQYGFTCNGGPPDGAQDAGVQIANCSTGTADLNSMTDYCCGVAAPPAMTTCLTDPTAPCGEAVGYSCTGSDSPIAGHPNRSCGTPGQQNGKMVYCCLD